MDYYTIFGFKMNYWTAFGFLGQFAFFMRFFVQWLYSERKKKSVIPIPFWYFSIAGGIILFIYASCYLKDIVFSLGQAFGLLVYSRNLMLIYREKKVNV